MHLISASRSSTFRVTWFRVAIPFPDSAPRRSDLEQRLAGFGATSALAIAVHRTQQHDRFSYLKAPTTTVRRQRFRPVE